MIVVALYLCPGSHAVSLIHMIPQATSEAGTALPGRHGQAEAGPPPAGGCLTLISWGLKDEVSSLRDGWQFVCSPTNR